ncbi:hypothetical protein [Streptomyces sp. NPDC057557]|uniref:hypothetical protein n=1 Tax=Streptomyces sp. NPDC057557 TaxID=3346167 RepID=UPI003679B0EA
MSRELPEAATRTTFRRHFPELATEISTIRLTPPRAPPAGEPSRYDKLVTRNAKLKRRNRELTDHLALATAHIQRITLENQRLRQKLEAATGVTCLADRIPSRRIQFGMQHLPLRTRGSHSSLHCRYRAQHSPLHEKRASRNSM